MMEESVEATETVFKKAIEQEKKHMQILKDEKLLDRCIEEIQKKVIGERETILTIF